VKGEGYAESRGMDKREGAVTVAHATTLRFPALFILILP